MPAPALTVLKYVFLAFLYLFFLRVLRAVWIELREPKTVDRPDSQQDHQDPAPAYRASATVGTGQPGASQPAGTSGNDATTVVSLLGPGGEPTVLNAAPRPATAPLGPPPAGPPTTGRLVLVEPPGLAGLAFPLAAELTVGRAPGCGVSLPEDTFVSSVHARVFNRGGRYHLEDLGSTNGTYLNGQRVGGPVRLEPGDRFRVGQSVLELVA